MALTTSVSLQSKLATSNTFTDTAAGSFSDGSVGINIDLDSNALGASGNSSYITAKETSNIPNTASVNVVGSKAKDINAYSGGSQVKNLQSGKTASIDLTYTKAELASSNIDTTTEVSNLKMVSYSEDKKEWESLSTVATYFDSASSTVASPAANLSDVSFVQFTAVGTHFSAYALSSPTGSEPPATPTSLTATPGAAVGGAVALTWAASSGAEGYYIYRDTSSSGSFALLANISSGSTVSYSDSSVSGGTTYFYKIAAYADGGSAESSASSAVSAAVAAAAGGGGTVGGGGGGGSVGATPRAQKVYPDGTVVFLDEVGAAAKMKELDAKFAATARIAKLSALDVVPKTAPAESASQPNALARLASLVFTRDLSRGARGDEVKRLQELLASDREIYPEGEITGFFGPATERALKRFQVKYQVVKSERSAGAGRFGPATRAKIALVFATVKPDASAVDQPAKVAGTGATAPIISRRLARGSRGEDVKSLQAFLSSDASLYPEGDITGFFGPATRRAIQRFQEKYGIAKAGDDGYGDVGPATRKKLKEISDSTIERPELQTADTPAALVPSEGSVEGKKQAIEEQLQAALKQLAELQKQLKQQ